MTKNAQALGTDIGEQIPKTMLGFTEVWQSQQPPLKEPRDSFTEA